ncbi:MAG: hypothetical protein ABIR06_17385 [Cyclobacteriaceae bacterium]
MKKTVLKICTIALLTLQISCQNEKTVNEANDTQVPTEQESPEKIIESIVGEWKIDRIISGDENVTDAQGGSDQTLVFTDEARYVMRSGNEKSDSGAYRMNEQLKNLYFESETNQKPQEWNVSFKSGSMILSPVEDSNNKNLQYIYRRASASSTKEN